MVSVATTDFTDFHSTLRCCMCCRQPWRNQTAYFTDVNTYISYGMERYFRLFNQTNNNDRGFYFARDVQDAHVIQKAHQEPAVGWFCDPTHDYTVDPLPVTFRLTGEDRRERTATLHVGAERIEQPLLYAFLNTVPDANYALNSRVLPTMVPCCMDCNITMDSVKQQRLLLAGTWRDTVHDPGLVPVSGITLPDGAVWNSNQVAKNHLGFFTAWYLQAALLYLHPTPPQRIAAVVLSWLVLSISAKFRAFQFPSSTTRKPQFTFLGVLNLYISAFVYLLLRLEYPDFTMSFARFYNFYLLEIPECTADGFWDRIACPYLHLQIFQRMRPDNFAFREVSDRLLDFYTGKVKPLYAAMVSGTGPLMDYFATPDEVARLLLVLPVAPVSAKNSNLEEYIQRVGISAVMWPFRRIVAVENQAKLNDAVDEWISYVVRNYEWKNLALNGAVGGVYLSQNEARIVYAYQFTLRYQEILRECLNDWINMLRTRELQDLQMDLLSQPRCSIFKGAVRLLALHFNDDSWKQRFPNGIPEWFFEKVF